MGQMQAKIMKLLRDVAEAAELEFNDQPQHANTGTFYVQRGLGTLVAGDYSFQDRYCTVDLYGENADRGIQSGAVRSVSRKGVIRQVDGRRLIFHRPGYDDGGALTALIDNFTKLLAAE